MAVVGDAPWRTRFGGDPTLVGRRVTLDGLPYTVVGVMSPDFRLAGVDVWLPVGRFTDGPRFVRVNHPGLLGVPRLKPGVTLEAMRADMARVARIDPATVMRA